MASDKVDYLFTERLVEEVLEVPKEVLREYLMEAPNQGWDGYTDDEVIAVHKFLVDLVLASKHMDDHDHYREVMSK